MIKQLTCFLALIVSTLGAFAQTQMSGKVVDRNGQPLEGISVKEKSGTAGAITDKLGNYSVNLSSGTATLVFSGVGFTTEEVTTTGKTFADVTLVTSVENMGAVEIVGTRSLRRSSTETPVPVDIIPVSRITNTLGQVDLNQILQYVAPSFNSNRQSGSDGADHVDPASLRGLGPDQTLVLVNGKRWHQSSLVNIFGSRGRGNTGTDLNTIPAAAIERIEILRDGAAAQYGSDAIAGVINIILKSAVNKGSATVSGSTFITGYGKSLDDGNGKIMDNQTDGETFNANVNYGFALKNNGFINLTADYLHRARTHRPNFTTPNPDDPRRMAGDAALENYGLYLNAGIPITAKTSFYLFGGINERDGSAFAYTRSATSERNVPSIYPNGFDPLIGSSISDRSGSFGIKTKFGQWNADFNATLGFNRFEYDVSKTLNTSLGASSPTSFDAGGFQLSQNMVGMHFTRGIASVAEGLNIALGTELRQDKYKIFAGEEGSYRQYPNANDAPGGSQGFPGFQPADETDRDRTNWGAYADAELDVTKSWMVSGAVRVENYNDFGWTTNVKAASRLKLAEQFALRGSISTGFRAPSLPQINFSNTFTNVAAGVTSEVVIAPNSGSLANAVGIPALKEETSVNASLGFTTRPVRNLSLTVDGYMVNIKDRVVLTGFFDQTDDVIGDILESRNIGSAQFFTNAVNTKTTGLDVILTYGTKAGKGNLSTTLAANFNKLEIEKINTVPKLAGKEDIYFSDRERYFLMASAPKHKVSFSVDYKINNFSTNLRLTNFAAIELIDYDPKVEKFKGRTTTDLSFSYLVKNRVTLTVGGANIFDVYPEYRPDPGLTETGTRYEAIQMGMGGAMYYAKIGVRL
ncbi:MAG: TonB-dependent receptor [Ferruginibacter sp.]|nr:TonB-dependent receptor [Ferruginibacter sp.]